jgi:hypothetical protein
MDDFHLGLLFHAVGLGNQRVKLYFFFIIFSHFAFPP